MPQSSARENEFVLLAAISITYQIVRSHVGTALALLRRELRHSASGGTLASSALGLEGTEARVNRKYRNSLRSL